uniref:F-box domain-containing protein n=1 Tax=Meloidogyne enterolobii TaxID=390850 RepID=A0A6V7TQK6_MELEN|nr:unnamed protein product [Meloidogyne enterolobii]
MFILPTEVQLDVLKCLNFNQLFSFKLTNFYFYNLINKYEGELARMKFNTFSFIDENPRLISYDIIELKSGVFELTLSDQLKNKWQAAIDRSIPLFLHEFKFDRTFVCISKVDKKTKSLLLKLPTFPKNIEEMITVRCWLEHLFKCAIVGAYIDTTIFNPEMINIKYITTSKDCSKMVPVIIFYFSSSDSSRFKFSERAEKIEIVRLDNKTHTNFQYLQSKCEICTL